MKFLELDWEQKVFFLQAFYWIGRVRLEIIRIPFKKLIADFDLNRSDVLSATMDQEKLRLVHLTSWAIQASASVSPWESTCFVKVLAAQRMLQKRGIGGVFFLGADREPNDRDAQGLSAHAWLKCGSEFVTGESGYEKYTVVSSFSWSG